MLTLEDLQKLYALLNKEIEKLRTSPTDQENLDEADRLEALVERLRMQMSSSDGLETPTDTSH